MSEPLPISQWHLDKRVPITLIFAILVQTGVMLWYGGQLAQRVATLEAIASSNALRGERLAAVEAKLGAVQDTLKRIENKIDRTAGDPAFH